MERIEYVGNEIPEVAEGKLPSAIEHSGKIYILKSGECTDEKFSGWWYFGYVDETGMPAYVHDKEYWYYLLYMDMSRKKAYNGILEKYCKMVK